MLKILQSCIQCLQNVRKTLKIPRMHVFNYRFLNLISEHAGRSDTSRVQKAATTPRIPGGVSVDIGPRVPPTPQPIITDHSGTP